MYPKNENAAVNYSQVAGYAEPERPSYSPVIDAMHSLGDEQARTDKLLAELHEKLQPVLSVMPEPPTGSGPKPAPLRQSPLHGRIMDYIENQEALNGLIARVIQRLTL